MMHNMHDLQCLNAGITPGCYRARVPTTDAGVGAGGQTRGMGAGCGRRSDVGVGAASGRSGARRTVFL